MTQQQISRIFDIPDRTLRDWKKSRSRLYTFLESVDYDNVKSKIRYHDIDDIVEFDPTLYSYNHFWQSKTKSQQKVYAIISNYLSSLNENDIKTLCSQYGKSMVRYVLKDKFKKLYLKGYISLNGIDIPLNGVYNKNEIYQKVLVIINDC